VQAAGDLAQAGGQRRLDGHVDVLFLGKVQLAPAARFPEGDQALPEGAAALRAHQPLPGEHQEVRQAPEEILPEEGPVER
jgi:hypothetical protein